MGFMGYRKRTSFLCGLTVAQISEFSLIFIAMGVNHGHIDNSSLGLVTLVGLVTIAVSIYMITYSQQLYDFLEKYLTIFEKLKLNTLENIKHRENSYDVVIFGMGRYGREIAKCFSLAGYKILGIDFNPEEIHLTNDKNIYVMYGDACDYDFLDNIDIHKTKYIISAMPERDFGLTHEDPRVVLIKNLKSLNYQGYIVVSTQNQKEVAKLNKFGANLVLLPYSEAAEKAYYKISKLNI
jgi:hypothetical protein